MAAPSAPGLPPLAALLDQHLATAQDSLAGLGCGRLRALAQLAVRPLLRGPRVAPLLAVARLPEVDEVGAPLPGERQLLDPLGVAVPGQVPPPAEVVLRAGEEFAPNYITSYLTELARAYNSFYGAEQIVKRDDPASPYKVALSAAFARVMQNGLTILGIQPPEKM